MELPFVVVASFHPAIGDSHSSKYYYKDIAFLMHIAAPGKIPEYPMQFVSNNGSNCQGITRGIYIYMYIYNAVYPHQH